MDLFLYHLKNLCHDCLCFIDSSQNKKSSLHDSMKQPDHTEAGESSVEVTQLDISPKKRKNNEYSNDEGDNLPMKVGSNKVERTDTSLTQWHLPIIKNPIGVVTKPVFPTTLGSAIDENRKAECINKDENLPMILNSYSISSKPAFEELSEDIPRITDAFSLREKDSLQRNILISEEVEEGINIDDALVMLP